MKRKAVWIGCILAALFCGRSANASYIVTLDQVGPNVEMTGSGTLNFTALTFFSNSTQTANIQPVPGNFNLSNGAVTFVLKSLEEALEQVP